MVTDNPLLLSAAIAILALALIGFPALMFVLIARGRARHRKYGSVSGSLMAGTVTGNFGEVPVWSNAPGGSRRLRVLGVQAESPAVGLELYAEGPGFVRLLPIRLEPAEAAQVAGWLEAAALGKPGGAPGGGWFLYRRSGFSGAPVRGLHGSLQRTLGATRWKLHVVSLGHPEAPIGLGIRGTLRFMSDTVTGALLTPSSARTLAEHLRQASAARAPAGA